ncbi:hypothetical protein [Candidatus Chromulinivorax destructor]|uniref:Uncharacterized protein n=1 Tax=Candidatus Chromulinivorax destructor TaxID=2066483 RepID=A0A345ZBC5_9BACT|nr:hypothetical protein [Candidatus Chromulinivorax destructor]AXK60592.1 hypothetical protein C0J27_02435 [Candidatus Chromulinivorax destructor]
MFQNSIKNMSNESKGMLASILGLILILGTLGKLQILQSILNSIMLLTGLALLFWGINVSNSYKKITTYLHKKK